MKRGMGIWGYVWVWVCVYVGEREKRKTDDCSVKNGGAKKFRWNGGANRGGRGRTLTIQTAESVVPGGREGA